MKIQFLLACIVLASTQSSFLEESLINRSFAPMMNILIEKSTDPTQQQQLETATPPDTLLTATLDSYIDASKQQQILIAQQYEQNLPANGDCIILYGECEYKGPSFKYCDQPGEYIKFDIPVHSVYIPIGMSLKIKDALQGNKLNLIYSHECISEGIHIPEPKIYEDHPNEWFGEIKESEKAVLDAGELATPQIKYYDNDGKVISKEEYQKLVEADIQRSHNFYLGIVEQPDYSQPQQQTESNE
ncbi:unnamed protein product (macronuclear) [Paramecium tetraurelia]|uniref:Uncharacterized protein n=1 Tax=Paramecium tetraurelia TaxID=5888 RepID=A0C795_PARTE|nr:uncharacterized protein GSPATT00035792001 [Paramecium tetraurelia]CAK66662.1 unnamed protein product [Paramecium tetraurelia]|eukprot:XP_001434059.1 hypothetical protein (macronuclear) [Paramecium tetraurelia strain d4-2]